MLEKGYSATMGDLSRYATKTIKIDRNTGLPSIARTQERLASEEAYLTAASLEPPLWINLKPGLNGPIVFYSVTHTQQGLVVTISDARQTRYYWFGKRRVFRNGREQKETAIVDFPSYSFEEGWVNLFIGVIANDRPSSVAFYREVAHLLRTYFVQGERARSFSIEGTCRRKKEHFVALLEWNPLIPNDLKVSSTLDPHMSRFVTILLHPINEVHKQCT